MRSIEELLDAPDAKLYAGLVYFDQLMEQKDKHEKEFTEGLEKLAKLFEEPV